MKKYPLFFLLVVLLCQPAAGTAETFLFVTLESPPAEFMDNGTPTGRNVEIVREACRRLELGCSVLIVPWERALNMVKTGTAHAIIDAAFNKERARFLHYPDEPIYVEQWYAFKRKGSHLTLDKDLANADQIRLGTSRGFEYGGIIQKIINAQGFKKIDETTGNESNIKKLVGNRFDMFVGVRLTILSMAKKLNDLDKIEIVKLTGTNENYLLSASSTYLAFSKKRTSQETADRFSDIFAKMKEDGTIRGIENKYY